LLQVKGTERAFVDVTLDVWKKLIEAPLPAFFVVAKYARGQPKPDAFYVVHVSGECAARAAERLWQFEAKATEEAEKKARRSARQSQTQTDVD